MKLPLVTRRRYERLLKKFRRSEAARKLLVEELAAAKAGADADPVDSLLDYRGELTPEAIRKLAGRAAFKRVGRALN